MQRSFDFLILGAGITGLCLAKEIKSHNIHASVLILEKEILLGAHGSGRNSGVLHSGIYYPKNSLKAKLCSQGAIAMESYCQQQQLPVNKIGKVIVPTSDFDDIQIDRLYQRGLVNGVNVSIIDRQQLKEIEPFTQTASNRALFLPDTAVVDPIAVLNHLCQELGSLGVKIIFNCPGEKIYPERNSIETRKGKFNYGYLINSTGQFSDKISHKFGVGKQYTQLPFKGRYYKLATISGIKFKRLVYPVPNLNVPFLGIHSVTTIHGDSYFGPSAFPAFGRENYKGLEGIELTEALNISFHLIEQYLRNEQGFREFSKEEAKRILKMNFFAAAKLLVPKLKEKHLLASDKVGIRAQLLDKKSHQLIMDFIVEHKGNTTHILNAISPAFTSAFTFSNYVYKQISQRLNNGIKG